MKLPRSFCGYRRVDIPKHELAAFLGEEFEFEDHEDYIFNCGPFLFIISENDRFEVDEERWRHLSMSTKSRIPTYREIKAARNLFFPSDAEVIMVFPPENEFVNDHPNCIHLWWSKDRRLSPTIMYMAVGQKKGDKLKDSHE